MSQKKVAAAKILDLLKHLAGLKQGTEDYSQCLVDIRIQAMRAGIKATSDLKALKIAAEAIINSDDNDGGGAPPPP